MSKLTDCVRFYFLVPAFYFSNRTAVKKFLFKQFTEAGKAVEAINYVFCNDHYLLEMNQEYLNHDTLTDIITFELSPAGEPLVADIYISIDRIRENSAHYHTSFSEELLRVIFHGALHLLGYKDKTTKQAQEMRKGENCLLQAYRVSRETDTKKKD